MGYKLNKALKKSKTSLIIALVLWVIITIVLVSPISYAVARSMINNKFDLNQFLTEIGPAITNISTLVKVFSEGHGPTFWKTWQIFSVIYLAFAIIGIIKARPKHEYTDGSLKFPTPLVLILFSSMSAETTLTCTFVLITLPPIHHFCLLLFQMQNMIYMVLICIFL